MKKIFKIIGIILLIFVVILIAIPFVLESKIDAIVQNYADKNINAKVEFDDVSLSLISSFPNDQSIGILSSYDAAIWIILKGLR